jgi:hypothetical protein
MSTTTNASDNLTRFDAFAAEMLTKVEAVEARRPGQLAETTILLAAAREWLASKEWTARVEANQIVRLYVEEHPEAVGPIGAAQMDARAKRL